jgi:glycerol uptake facilitator-like aquaporin
MLISVRQVALAFGLTYAAVLYCVRNVGDAHLNPSITIALMTTRRSSLIAGLFYLIAQFFGAVIGAALVFGLTAAEYRRGGRHGDVGSQSADAQPDSWWPGGSTVPSEHTTEAQAFAVELFATFLFVFVVFAAYDKTKADRVTPAAPFVVGLANAAVLLFSVSSSREGTESAPADVFISQTRVCGQTIVEPAARCTSFRSSVSSVERML